MKKAAFTGSQNFDEKSEEKNQAEIAPNAADQ